MAGPWTDAHCHLADSRFARDLDAVIRRSRDAGVSRWVQGGVDPEDWRRQRALRDRYGDGIVTSFGAHPWWVSGATDAELDAALEELEAALPEARALGELGLDHHPRRLAEPGSAARQRRSFIAQIDLARRFERPLVLHIVRAHDDALGLLEKAAPFAHGGLVHSFGGSAEHGKRYIELGFLLSISASSLDRPRRVRALEQLPVSSIAVETDSPDQVPRAWETQRNEPCHLLRIAEGLAPIWGTTGDALLDRSRRAVNSLFES